MEKVAREGYIIILTLLVISSITVLLTSVVQQSVSFQAQVRLATEKARARLLALSSLELAMSQLSTVVPKEEQKEEKEGDKKAEQTKEVLEPVQKWLLKVLPSINRWQTIEITEPGLEGTIKMYLACEEGKFNLAAFEEEGKKKEEPEKVQKEEGTATPEQPAKKDVRKDATKGAKKETKKEEQPEQGPLAALDDLFKKIHDVSMKEAFKRFLTEQKRLPEDATELLRVPYFAKLKDRLFTPLVKEHRGLYIMDLFTVRPRGSDTVNPWLLTTSAKTLLGIREQGDLDEEFVKKIKPTMNWEKDWDEVLAPRYGKNFAAFDPAIQKVFASAFEAKAFSVVSYCTVGSVTQKLYAVLEVTEPDNELSSKSVIFKVTKLYWL